MSAKAGKQYTVVAGDTLSGIAAQAYGDGSLWPRIKQANQSQFKDDNPDTIFPGQKLNIPLEADLNKLKTELASSRLSNKKLGDLTILIDGSETEYTAARVIRTMDTFADGWTATIPWNPGEDEVLDKKMIPFSYPTASIYIGGELIVNGVLYTHNPSLSVSGSINNVEGWSFTADGIDSTIKPPYEKNKTSLEQIATELADTLGIKAIFDFDSGGAFDRITASPSDTIFSHLSKLAEQRGLILTSTPSGDMLFTKTIESKSVGTLEEGDGLTLGFGAKFDGRQRFNAYRVIGQSPSFLAAKVGIANDDNVPRSRFLTSEANETTKGNIINAADWKRSKQIAKALEIPFNTEGWYAPDGSLWAPNTNLTVNSKTLGLPNGFTFAIKRVELSIDENKQSAKLSLVPPQVFTGEPLEDPWGQS